MIKSARSHLMAIAFLLLFVAACAPLDLHQIRVSKLPDRSFADTLQGQTVARDIYPFISPDTDVTEVRFYLDDPGLVGEPHSTESIAPFDLAGGQSWKANPFDTEQLRDGPHSLTAVATLTSGKPVTMTASFQVNNATTINDSIYWGVSVEGVPWDMAKLATFEATVGKAPSIVHFWLPWTDRGALAPLNPVLLENVRDYGGIPMVSWLPARSSQGVDQPDYRLAQIIDGKYDAYVRQWAAGAKDWGHPFMIRFAHEMNGFWFPWGESANGNQKGDFVKAWKHVVDIFRSAGATNVTWVWCPNIDWAGSGWPTMQELYPGDDYVDWTCLDGFNWGSTRGSWTGFDEVFRWSYENVRSIAPSKPMLIGEFGSAEQGGSKADWITDAVTTEIPHDYPGLKAVVWYNFADSQDWRVETSPAAIDAFKAAIGSSYYSTNSYRDLTTSPIPALR